MLPRRITRILKDMDKHDIKPPMCNDCCGAKATRRSWRFKGDKSSRSHIKKAVNPGDVVSVDQQESSIPGSIGQITGRLTKQMITCSTVYVDHASDLNYVFHQTSISRFSRTSRLPSVQNQHHFGYPTYFLKKE
jgi:hypothetical protein